jgi:hypothetical protein
MSKTNQLLNNNDSLRLGHNTLRQFPTRQHESMTGDPLPRSSWKKSVIQSQAIAIALWPNSC